MKRSRSSKPRLRRLPPDAVILNFTTPPEWKRYAVFGMYAQLVDGERPDVTHLFSPDLRELARDLEPDAPIFVYAPVEMLAYFFELAARGTRFIASSRRSQTPRPRRHANEQSGSAVVGTDARGNFSPSGPAC